MPLSDEERTRVGRLLRDAHNLTFSEYLSDEVEARKGGGEFAVLLGPILLMRSLGGGHRSDDVWTLFVLGDSARVHERRVQGGGYRIETLGPSVLIQPVNEGPWWDRLRAELPRIEHWVEEAKGRESQAEEDQARKEEAERLAELELARGIIEQTEPVSSISVPK